jgi:hypothetical protein
MRKELKKMFHYLKKTAWVASVLCCLSVTPGKAGISYGDILAAPDNIALNRQYAFEQLEIGNAKNALAAIERVLVAQPTDLPARLFRARVLMALGSDLQAEAELRALDILPLPTRQAQLVDDLLTQIRRRGLTWQNYLSVNLGFSDNDNVNNYPDNGRVTARGVENDYTTFDIEGNEFTEPLDDQAVSYNLALNSIYKTNSQLYDQIFFNLGIGGASEGDTGYLDNTAHNVGTGMRFVFGNVFVTPVISFSDIENDMAALGNLTITTYRLTARRNFGRKGALNLSVGQSERAFEGTKASNDGETLSVTLEGSYQLLPSLRLGVSANRQDVTGDTNNDLTKQVDAFGLSAVYQPMRGHRLRLSYQTGDSAHDYIYSGSVGQNNIGQKREDETLRYGAVYSLAGAVISPRLQNFLAELTYDFAEIESNFTDYQNDRTSVGLSLSYTKSF